MKTILKGSINIINVFKENDVMLSVQVLQLSKVTELKWDGASELIPVERSGRATKRLSVISIEEGSSEIIIESIRMIIKF